MNHGSLFSGIGGFDLAAQWMGWENIFHCEWNPFGQKVLKYHWPQSISYGDITRTDFTIHRGHIDVLSGGFPCQPYSAAGKRLGKEDDRHLWPEMLRAIREIRPGWVVGENVRGLTNWNGGLVFDEVQADLEAEGYEVLPFLLPACAVNAPHRRDRIWFVAYSGEQRCKNDCINGKHGKEGKDRKQRPEKFCKSKFSTTDPTDIGLQQPRTSWTGSTGLADGGTWSTTDPTKQGLQDREQHRGSENAEEDKAGMDNRPERSGSTGTTPDTDSRRQPSKEYGQTKSRFFTETGVCPDWENFPTQSPICDRNDGISDRLVDITFPKWRNESIKAMGNAIVPQVVYEIFKIINQCLYL